MSVYFVKGDDHIKIGFSVHAEGRINELNSARATELEVVAVVPGSPAFEHAIHSHLSQFRERGEWFRDCEDVRRTIASIVEHGPAAIGFREAERIVTPLPRKDEDVLDEMRPVFAQIENLMLEARRTKNKDLLRDCKTLIRKVGRLIDKAILAATEDQDFQLVRRSKILVCEVAERHRSGA